MKLMTRNRLIIFVLILTMIIIPNQIHASAIPSSSNINVTIGNIQGYVGQIVDVPVIISKPKKGIASYGIELNYDKSVLKVKGIKSNGASKTCSTSNEQCFWSTFDDSLGFLRAAWVDTTGGDRPISDSETLFTIQFQIMDNRPLDSTGLSAQVHDKEAFSFTDSSNQPLSVSVQGGRIVTSLPPSNVNTRQVDVTVGQNMNSAATVSITRQNENGVKIDEVNLDESKAEEIVKKAIAQKQDVSTIVLNDLPQDVADEMKINVMNKALGQLGDKHIILQIQTPSATVSLPKETVRSLNMLGNDLYFRVAQIRKEGEQEKAIQSALSSSAVKMAVGDKAKDVQVYGHPITIETNYANYQTDVLFPLNGLSLPTDKPARDAFLNTLRVFVKHTDGTEELLKGDILTDKNGEPRNLKIRISKFSTFTVLGVPNTTLVNKTPVASHVTISGSGEVGTMLKGTYQYADADQDPQGKTAFRWYLANNISGQNKQIIKGANNSTYRITYKDKGKYIGFEVFPIASAGSKNGKGVLSPFTGKIVEKNTAPTINGVKILGEAKVGKTVHVTYHYHDADRDKEGKTIFKWFRADKKKKQLIQGANKSSYKLTPKDASKQIVVEITPIAKSGVKTGTKRISKAIKPGEIQYNVHLELGVISSKAYVERVGSIVRKYYSGQVVIKKSGSYYKLTANFKTRAEAVKAGKDLKRRKVIKNYTIN